MTKLPPLCRYCGKEIAKRAWWTYLVTDPKAMEYSADRKKLVQVLPQTRTEAQKLFNEQIIAVKRDKRYLDGFDGEPTDMGIDQVSLWDGESYVDEFFCTGTHAQKFAYVMARADHCTKAYVAAVKKQKE